MRSINEIADILELNDGYRIISNVGKVGGQEVPTSIFICSVAHR